MMDLQLLVFLSLVTFVYEAEYSSLLLIFGLIVCLVSI